MKQAIHKITNVLLNHLDNHSVLHIFIKVFISDTIIDFLSDNSVVGIKINSKKFSILKYKVENIILSRRAQLKATDRKNVSSTKKDLQEAVGSAIPAG